MKKQSKRRKSKRVALLMMIVMIVTYMEGGIVVAKEVNDNDLQTECIEDEENGITRCQIISEDIQNARHSFDTSFQSSTSIPENAFEYNGHFYYCFTTALTWQEAETYCENLGGHLATITSQEENDAVYAYMVGIGCESAYFGLTDYYEEDTWVWVTGETISYTNWHSGEPNNENNNEDYAMFYYKYSDGTWNDGDFGGLTENGGSTFICEWETIDQDFSKDIHLLSGEWEGCYYAQQGKTALKLEITSIDKNGNVEAIFNFSEHPDNLGVPNGKYTMTGTYDFLSKKIILMANEWIDHPSGYLLLGINADVDTEKLIISGKTGSYSGLYLTKSSNEITVGGCIAIDQEANDLEGCTIALSGTLTLEASTEASEANLQEAIDSLKFESSDDSKAKVLVCNAVQSKDHRSATLEIWTALYNKGTATITVTAADGHTSKCEITVAEDTSEDDTSYEGDYTSEMREFLLNKGTLNTLKYLCNDANFTASTFVVEKDATMGSLLATILTDTYYRGWDGWRDLIDGSTSVEEAEKIIASLLGAYQSEIEDLSKAKTAQEYAEMINDAFSDYTKATNLFKAMHSDEIEVVRKYFSESNIARLLYEGKYSEITAPVNQILQDGKINQILQDGTQSEVFQQGSEAAKSWNKMMEGFTQSAEVSKILKKGCQTKLGKLEIGGGLSDIGYALGLVSCAQDTLNYLYRLESLLTADEMYCEMLLYVQENCVYSVVQEAAGNLYSVINDGVEGIISDISVKAGEKIEEKIFSTVLDKACKKSLPLTIIEAGFDWGVDLSNTFFKTGSTQELKDSLRSQVFLANCLSSWVLNNEMDCLSAIDTDEEMEKGKELYYSLYMLWESRKNAEETLQSLLRTTGADCSANYSVSTRITSTLRSFKENIFTKENMEGLLEISVSCPVDIEVYDKSGLKLLTVRDGTECQGYEKGIYYYCVYNPLSGDYDKYIYYSEDADYDVRVVGNDLGLADCSISRVDDEGYISEFYFENMEIDKGTVIDLDGISKDGVDYKVTDSNGSETSDSMESRKTDKIATLSISLNTDLLGLEVGEKRLLTVSFVPADATDQKVVWDSSDDAVVSVNTDGVITAVAAGTAVITVSQGDLEQTCKITVKEQNDPGSGTTSGSSIGTTSGGSIGTSSASPKVSPTASLTASPKASSTASPKTSPTISPTASPKASPTASLTASPKASSTASPKTSSTISPTASPKASPTASPKASLTVFPEESPTISLTASPTETTTGTGGTTATPGGISGAVPTASASAIPSPSALIMTTSVGGYMWNGPSSFVYLYPIGDDRIASFIWIPPTVTDKNGKKYPVTEIAENAFSGCTGLKEISIPTSVKKIRKNAFADCSSLSRVSYSGSREDWEAITIESGNEHLADAYEMTLSEESSAFQEKQVKIKSVKSRARRKVTVKWKKVSGADGYRVRYSRKRSMAGSKKKTVEGTSTVLKKLARRKRYYVRVRAYKYIGGEKVYTSWSSRWSTRVR